jgi:RimJ/RimL family protein N-acetyltransferase
MLHGKSVVLRAVEKEDVDQIKEWLADPELLHALGARPIPLASVDPEKLPEQFRLRDGRILAVVSKDKHLLGLVALGNIHEHNRTASVMVLIGDRGEWNRGYGSDALRTAVRFAFEDLNLNCVEAQIPRFNSRGQHVFEKVGFVVEGTLRNRFYGRGRYWDVVVASAQRDDWNGERQTAAPAQSQASQPPQGQAAAPYQGQPTAPPPAPPPAAPQPTYGGWNPSPPPAPGPGPSGRETPDRPPTPSPYPPAGSASPGVGQGGEERPGEGVGPPAGGTPPTGQPS